MQCALPLDCRALYSEGVTHEQAGRSTEAQTCYQRSAALGYGRSEFRLGLFFLEGKAQAPDKPQAFAYFKKAAQHEHRDQAKACFNAALMLATGDGIAQNLLQACFWYEEALKLGNAGAAPQLAALQERLQALAVAPKPVVPAVAPAFKAISHSELTLHEAIGQGHCGVVHRATWRDHETVAVKQFNAQLSEAAIAQFKTETQAFSQLISQRLVRLIGICTSPDPNCLVMEYLAKGSLEAVLGSQAYLSWPMALQIGIDIAQGLCYLHQEKLIHRDLKSQHILLDEHYRAKIGNFGLSRVKKETFIQRDATLGTVAWMAPEVFGLKPRYGEASDVYALGIILWELFSRQRPYHHKSVEEIKALVKAGGRAVIPDGCPPGYQSLIERCWAANPLDRPSAAEVVSALQAQQALATAASHKSWHCDPTLKPKAPIAAPYHLIDLPLERLQSDVQKVVDCYQRAPVPQYDLKSIRVVYNAGFNRAFEARLMALEGRHNNPGFTPQWSRERHPAHRKAVLERLEQMSAPYRDPTYPEVKILAMWHGTKPAILDSIFRTGFANLASTDPGFYGKGIYSAFEASYAYRVYSQGALLLNFVAFYSAYPVIEGDMPKLTAGANYQNYDAHFIPVKPANPHNPHEENYLPCAAQELAQYHELVVFESAQCLPRYLIELQPSLPQGIGALPSQAPSEEPPKAVGLKPK